MKRFLAPILLMVFLLPSLALGLEMNDLVEREGLYYEKFTVVLFTGEVTGKIQGQFKDGKREGLWTSFYENGQLWWKGPYKDGKLNGPYVWYYDNGQLWSEETYKDGEIEDGPYLTYHENGQLWSEETYKDGKREGPWVTYWGNGTVVEEYTGTFKDGVKVE